MIELALFDLPECVAKVRRRIGRRCARNESAWVQLELPFGEQIGRRNKSVIAPGRWFEIQPLLDWFGRTMYLDEREHVRREFAATIGMTQRNLRRRIKVGVIDGDTADEWATACEIEPAWIWDDWYDDLDGLDELDLCDVCGSDITGNPWCCIEQEVLL